MQEDSWGRTNSDSALGVSFFFFFLVKGPFSTAGSKASFEAGFSGLGVRVEGLGINEGFGVWSLGLRMSG